MKTKIASIVLMYGFLSLVVLHAFGNDVRASVGPGFVEGNKHILYVSIPADVSREDVLHPNEILKDLLYSRISRYLAESPDKIDDLVVIYTDHDGQPILPDLEAARSSNSFSRQPSVPPGKLTFTFNSAAYPWTEEELTTLSTALNDFYPMAKTVYGEPAFNITVNVRKDPAISFSGEYSPTMNEIVLRNASQLDVLCHEMIHAFRDDDMITINNYEEGMTRAVEVEVFNRLGAYTFWNEHHSYIYDVYYEGLNRQVVGSQFGNFDYASPFLLLRYELTGYAWAKVFFENSDFFIDFNKKLYAKILSDPTITANESELLEIAAYLQPTVEGKPFRTWYDQQGVLTTVHQQGYYLYQNISNFNVYYFYRDMSGTELMQPNAMIQWAVYDYQDNPIDSGSDVTSSLGWISINPVLPADYRGRIKIAATVLSPDGLISNTAMTSIGQDAGIFGIVPDANSGIITISPLDNTAPAISLEVLEGAFSAPAFATVKGRFIATYSDNYGQTFSKQFNKDAGRYFLSMVKSDAAADLSVSQTSIPVLAEVENNLTYLVAVKNNGPDSAAEVVLTDILPSGMTFVSAAPSQGICTFSAQVVTCALNTLANGSSARVAIVAAPTLTGSMENATEVSGNVTDPNTANNSVVLMSEVTASVPSVIESIVGLIDDISNLVDAGIFNRGQGNALISILETARIRVGREKANTAINELHAFVQHLEAFARAGVLPQQQAETLITIANYIIAELSS